MSTNDQFQRIAFLNGEEGLESCDERYFAHLKSIGKECLLIDNLFANPGRLKEIADCDALVLHTTGFNSERLRGLFDLFRSLNYAPTHAIFSLSEDPFLSLCFELKGKTKFYRLDMIDNEPYELEYLNS